MRVVLHRLRLCRASAGAAVHSRPLPARSRSGHRERSGRPMRVRLLMRLAPAVLTVLAAVTANAQPNVVLISIDTLRADHLSAYGYPVRTTPFIDSLARKGLLFEEAVTPLPSTTPSHASMLTSLYPPRHGSTTLALPVSRDVDTLAAVFRRNGYYTAASVAVNHLGRNFNFDRGFVDF